MEVIDGQHRLYAASILKIPIFYQINPGATLRTVQVINGNLTQWSPKNFLGSFIATGHQEYILLKQFSEKYELGIVMSIYLLTGSSTRNKESGSLDAFKRGELKITHLKEAIEFAEQLRKLSAYLEGNFWKTFPFIRALEIIYQDIDPDEFRRLMASSTLPLRRRPNVREYLRDAELISNYRRSKNVIRFNKNKKEVNKVKGN